MARKDKKKVHDQTISESHEGFREGVTKYSYLLEWKGVTISLSQSNLETTFEVGHYYNCDKGYFQIRRIQQSWMYGRLLTLIHLEKTEECHLK